MLWLQRLGTYREPGFEGDTTAHADRVSLASSWSAAPDTALAALQGAAGATDKLARARAAREAREAREQEERPPPTLRRQPGGEDVTTLETSLALRRAGAMRSSSAQPSQGPPPAEDATNPDTNRWELSLTKAISSERDLASRAAGPSGQPHSP